MEKTAVIQDPFSNSAAASFRTASYHSQPSDRQPARRQQFKSYRLNGEYERPWLGDSRLKRSRVGSYIIWGFVGLGLAISAYINFTVTQKVSKHQYCLILDDQFSSLNEDTWNREIDGFGTGAFDWTTTDEKNAFVDGEGLHIVPTLTTESTSITPEQLVNGYTLNLTKAGGDGSCTGTTNTACSIRSNKTTGAIIPPIRSARLNTKGKKSIQYGRVEVVAKMPKGDWLWPAILNETYGAWPTSGEIDILETRGNDVDYVVGGRDIMSSSLHWGPTPETDSFWRSTRGKALRRTDYSRGFHTFGIEWSKDYLFTYIDSPLQQVLYWGFDKDQNMWQKGHYEGVTVNSSLVKDPWSQTGNPNTPFDQPFFLIMNVAVGSSNGWFPDGIGGKPWTDVGQAASDFYSIEPLRPGTSAQDAGWTPSSSIKQQQDGGAEEKIAKK
ncbi:glycosyl hydrolase family protein [Microsporum canis CBS 113480]|uniref:Glycosyl hydrolase family protein n=1 Tax=Arthroderma otae (strain ATCC MYA-4605 / CBS 113480) TaxID=554155 RepID=C5G161_ARTOC|nr:glycosyl hydrolase family protein [Microsporum canis CBS 113480]EEQ35864.1 glycosyl hydrolase family protein [Microsporum canis CBS 113480]